VAFAFVLALGVVPALVFGVLVASGVLGWIPGLAGWGICAATALIFAVLLGRDIAVLQRLMNTLRSDGGKLPDGKKLLVPGMRALGQEANSSAGRGCAPHRPPASRCWNGCPTRCCGWMKAGP
jgi:hypothetical protein